jgi:hypothetical protein
MRAFFEGKGACLAVEERRSVLVDGEFKMWLLFNFLSGGCLVTGIGVQ